MRDKRKFPRLDQEWQLTYRVVDKEEFVGDPIQRLTVNISGGGICFQADEEIDSGTMVALELQSDQFPSPILALAKVVWNKRRRRGGYEVGAEFWWIGWQDNDAQQSIANYIASAAHTDEDDT